MRPPGRPPCHLLPHPVLRSGGSGGILAAVLDHTRTRRRADTYTECRIALTLTATNNTAIQGKAGEARAGRAPEAIHLLVGQAEPLLERQRVVLPGSFSLFVFSSSSSSFLFEGRFIACFAPALSLTSESEGGVYIFC